MESKNQFSFINEACPLQDILRNSDIKYPEVIWIYKARHRKSDNPTIREIMSGSLVLLEREIVSQYVRLQVLDFKTSEGVTERNAGDVYKRRNAFVGKDILIPLEYSGKLTPIHRSFKRKDYWKISQIIDESLRYVRLEDDIEYIEPEKRSSRKNVIKGTKLEVKRVFEERGNTFIELVDAERHTFLFNKKRMLHYSAIPNKTTQSLVDYITSSDLPKIVQFDQLSHVNVAKDDYFSITDDMSAILAGPVRLIETVTERVIVGWLKDEQNIGNFKCIVMPDTVRNGIFAKRVIFNSDTNSDFASECFSGCGSPTFVDTNDYFVKRADIYVSTHEMRRTTSTTVATLRSKQKEETACSSVQFRRTKPLRATRRLNCSTAHSFFELNKQYQLQTNSLYVYGRLCKEEEEKEEEKEEEDDDEEGEDVDELGEYVPPDFAYVNNFPLFAKTKAK